MKLRKSVSKLTQHLELFFNCKNTQLAWIEQAQAIADEYQKMPNKTYENVCRRIRWDLWWVFPKYTRDAIIAESIPEDTWVGGYPDVTDAQLDTLLRKCMGFLIDKALAFNEQRTVFYEIDNANRASLEHADTTAKPLWDSITDSEHDVTTNSIGETVYTKAEEQLSFNFEDMWRTL